MDGSEENSSPAQHYHVVLLGKTGGGKSATANTILGRKAFISKLSFKTVTKEVQSESVTKDGLNITVYDTPGFFDPENKLSPEEMYQGLPELDRARPDPLVILLVIRPGRFTEEEKCTVEMIEDYLPDWLIKSTWIIFTRGDDLERGGCTIEDLIGESEDLKKVVQKFDNRYFVFNNVTEDPAVVNKLIGAIRNVQPQRSSVIDTVLQRQSPEEHETSTNERRLLLLGKTGSGKSATGNTILRKHLFKSEPCFSSVTQQCEVNRSVVSGREVSAVDTPGFSDLTSNPEDLAQEMANSVALCSPGPHAFLYVVSLTGRMKHEDENDIKNIEIIYGKEVAKYTIPVFTHSDLLEEKSVEDLIRENETLSQFVQQCGGRFHIMNNKDTKKIKQVNDLLQKIDTMIEQNGGHYSNQMFKDAERFRREEEERRPREEEQERQGEEEEEERPKENDGDDTKPKEKTKESWNKKASKRAKKFVYMKFQSIFNAAAERLNSLDRRICKLLGRVKLTCMAGDGSNERVDIQTNNDHKHTGQTKSEEAQQL